ncbi:MAG: hypothetical protein ACRDV3_03485 [Acidothermaceae bacterium]
MSTRVEREPAEAGTPPSRATYRGALIALLVLGAVVGLISGLQATRLWDLGALHLSVGGLAAFVANALFGVLGAWGLRSRDAAFVPGAGWFLAVLGLLFLPHPGGDIVVPGSGGDAIGFLVLGFVGIAGAAIVAARLIPRPVRTATPVRAKRR